MTPAQSGANGVTDALRPPKPASASGPADMWKAVVQAVQVLRHPHLASVAVHVVNASPTIPPGYYTGCALRQLRLRGVSGTRAWAAQVSQLFPVAQRHADGPHANSEDGGGRVPAQDVWRRRRQAAGGEVMSVTTPFALLLTEVRRGVARSAPGAWRRARMATTTRLPARQDSIPPRRIPQPRPFCSP